MIFLCFILAAIAYGAATFAYGLHGQDDPAEGDPGVARRFGRPSLATAALFHTVLIGLQCVHGDHPLKNIFLAGSFGALITVVGYLGLSRTRALEALGAVFAPLGLGALALGVVFSNLQAAPVVQAPGVGSAHVVFATAGLAGFTLAAGVASLYLLTERRLRNKRFRPGSPGMSLTGLDRLHHRLVLLVTPVFTLAIVTGVLWIAQLGGPHMLRQRSFEIAAAALAWLASVGLLVTRAVWGSRGRRSAWLTIVAFAAVALIAVSYGVRT